MLSKAKTNIFMINLENIDLKIADKQVLKGINLKVEQGDFITIIGPNGAGKTSLIKVILGNLKPTNGSVKVNKNIKIGYVPQKITINNTMPINLEYFLKLNLRPQNKVNLEKIICDLKLTQYLKQQIHNLSGGILQKSLLAKALLNSPNLLILDEPAQNLDIASQIDFYKLIQDLHQKENITILMVSHDLHLVMANTKKVICLFEHICCSGVPEDIKKHPEFISHFGSKMDELLAVYNHHHTHKHG